eukprot:CAMPEP_0114604188 /NCGR_PEP_ID=MMETSP0168-20121206/418_1 /TAXON_ID=95228 ORGANISM="Vannella sp., Strain DIVA3 517/6/12" /NCGR_SAMPLE_ID=MMETSP0168 /ASSEMBLY_ACC=CAM_ASM_000044 /LENGTH=562 /DNA_ID=CAMNT_0001815015 /DNA_START=55 /DNA_END=1740 /DNA_ORIENTATION=+
MEQQSFTEDFPERYCGRPCSADFIQQSPQAIYASLRMDEHMMECIDENVSDPCTSPQQPDIDLMDVDDQASGNPLPFSEPSSSPSSSPVWTIRPEPLSPAVSGTYAGLCLPKPDAHHFFSNSEPIRCVRQTARACFTAPPAPTKTSGGSKLQYSGTQVAIHACENFRHESPDLTAEQCENYYDDNFVEKGRIGKGNFADVYKVLRKAGGDECFAIKVSKRPWSRDKAVKELQIVKGFNHPHVLQYIFAWEQQEKLYIQTELCGQSLDDYTSERLRQTPGQGSLPYIEEHLLWQYLTDMVLGLHHIHRAGFLHLDIKPENILFDSAGRLKIADFGLIVSIEEASGRKDVEEGDSRFLAPELLDDEAHLSASVDIFSLGVTMFQLATLIKVANTEERFTQLRTGNLEELMGLECYSAELKETIKSMMSASATCRPTADNLLANERIAAIVAHRLAGTGDYVRAIFDTLRPIDCSRMHTAGALAQHGSRRGVVANLVRHYPPHLQMVAAAPSWSAPAPERGAGQKRTRDHETSRSASAFVPRRKERRSLRPCDNDDSGDGLRGCP